MSKVCLSGRWRLERYTPYGVLIARQVFPNDIMLAQIDALNNTFFRNGSPETTWSIGLIGGATVTVTTADTMASHAGWTEDENYSEATRVAWGPDASASQVIGNGTAATFTINSDTTIRGLFLTSENTKGGATGSLWSAAAAAIPEVISAGQTLRAFYDLTSSGV